MAEENGWGEEITNAEKASKGHSSVKEIDKVPDDTDGKLKTDTSKKKEETTPTVPFYQLFSFADSWDYLLMFVGAIAAAGSGISMPLMSILFGDLIDSFGTVSDSKDIGHEVSKVSLEFVYLAVGSGVASFLQVTCWMLTGERQTARIRSLFLKSVLRQDVGFFDKFTSAGDVVGKMSGDTVLIQDAMGEKVGKFIQLIATFLGGFVVAFVQGWLLTLVMLSCFPPLVIFGALITMAVAKLASRGQAAYSSAAVVLEQTIGSIRTVASFTGEKQAIAKYNQSLSKAYKSGVQEAMLLGLSTGTFLFTLFGSYGLAMWYGSKMVVEKGYTGGTVINVLFSVMAGSMALGQTSPCLSAFGSGQAAAVQMFETIKRKPQIDACRSGKILDGIQGDVELRDVHFSYPTRPDEQVFQGFSLSIPSGTTAALVGESGSGKSTVISLIERFYDPLAGEVLIDGIDLREFQLRWIRGKIGLVSQEPVLFTSSIGDNIAYGKDGATIEEIRAAAEIANAAKFIDKLPQGLDTMVGEHGTQLSGGQKQRVAIARAILKDPRILLLDEATSALDAESERVVQDALDRVMINRTTIIVAHRLSTVRSADMIAVIHRGKIVEKGSHSELMKDPVGTYSQLVRLQEIHDHEKSDILVDSDGHSSDQMSLLPSISRSSRVGQSSRHSFNKSFGATPEMNIIDKAPLEHPPKVPLRRLANLNKPEMPFLLLGTIVAAVNGGVSPVFGILISSSIKSFFKPPHELLKDARFSGLTFLFLGLVSISAYPLRSYLFSTAGLSLIRRVRAMCFEKVVHMEVSWFDKADHSSGSIGARLSVDAAMVRSLVGDALSVLVQNTATIIIGLVIAFVANWKMSFIVLVLLPLLAVDGYFQIKFMKSSTAEAKKKYEAASQVASDAVGSIRTVASFCAEEKVMQLYQQKCEGPMNTGIREGLVCGIGYGVSFFFLFTVYAATFYGGARLVEAGQATFNEVFRVFFVLSLAGSSVSQTSSLAPDTGKAKDAAASIFAILDCESKIDSSDDSGTTLQNVEGEIEFHHVSFRYPTRPEIQIFRDLCLAIHSGKTVALVGESGSGKSTAISLLQRFYDPDSGHVTLDGVEIQKLQLKWLRQQMGLVSQEPVLFNETIRANISYGKEGNATEAEIYAAAELANAHKFISSLQQGYDATVGERGIQLSGGQKQRVAIARAMVKDPKILLLDEATSALDAESERVVQDALDRVMANRTTLVVAHRLSTIKGADLIAVVKNGVIAEKGRHETLINIKHGIYASLAALQMSAPSY